MNGLYKSHNNGFQGDSVPSRLKPSVSQESEALMKRFKVIGIFAIALIITPVALAVPGDKLFIQKDVVNIRTGPGTDKPVLLKLNKGHELVEFHRIGDWLHVGITRTGGKDGWVHRSLVGTVSPLVIVKAPPSSPEQDPTVDLPPSQKAEVSEGVVSDSKPLEPAKELAPAPGSENAIQSPPDEPVESRYPYSVRTGSFKSLKHTEKAIASLEKNNLSPYWCKVDLGEKGKWFRLFVGYFMTKEQAEKFRETHALASSFISNTAYAVQIAEYASYEGLAQKISTLEESGYSPYVIGNQQERYRLLIGAFVTQGAATELAHNLQEAGTDCEVVLR